MGFYYHLSYKNAYLNREQNEHDFTKLNPPARAKLQTPFWGWGYLALLNDSQSF